LDGVVQAEGDSGRPARLHRRLLDLPRAGLEERGAPVGRCCEAVAPALAVVPALAPLP